MRIASLILISFGISIGTSLTASAQAGNDFAITGHSKLNAEDKGKDENKLRRHLDVLKEQKKQITKKIQQKENCGSAC
jgi:hypothetical protein